MFDNINRTNNNDRLSTSEVYTDSMLSDNIQYNSINLIGDELCRLHGLDTLSVYELRTPLDNIDLALCEADVALRLFGHRRIGVDIGPGDTSVEAASMALAQLAQLCRRRGAVLILCGPAPP